MSKYIGVSIKKREYDNRDIRYEIYWTKQHTIFGIKLHKFSEVKDYITFEYKWQAEDYIQNVTRPIKHRNLGEGYFDYILTDFPLEVNYNNKNAVYDKFLFYNYEYLKQHNETFNSIEEYKKCVVSKSNIVVTLNK